MNPNSPNSQKPQLQTDALDAALAQYGSPDALVNAARSRAIKSTRDYFATYLGSISLTVGDWKDLLLFLNQPNTAAFNIQSIHEQLHGEIADAVTNQDPVALLVNLMLFYKAYRRA